LIEDFQLNAFTLDYCDIKITVFYSHLQKYGTTQTMKPHCCDLLILLECMVLNGIIIHFYCTTLNCSIYISCITFFLILSKWFVIHSLATGWCIWQCGPHIVRQRRCGPELGHPYQAAKLPL